MVEMKMNDEELLEVITNLDDAKEAVDVLYRCNNALNRLQTLTKGLADLYRIQRDEARQVASNYRDKYVGRIGSDGSRDRLPWEEDNGADRDGC